jgi:hypothetical protein
MRKYLFIFIFGWFFIFYSQQNRNIVNLNSVHGFATEDACKNVVTNLGFIPSLTDPMFFSKGTATIYGCFEE